MIKLDTIHISMLPVVRSQVYQEPLNSFLENILPQTNFQPKQEDIFKVFRMPLNKIKVVILGIEPPTSSTEAIRSSNYRISIDSWKGQGVFLLNSALTVETGNPNSHLPYWRNFTENIIKYISYNNPCIWILWGRLPRSFQGDIYKPFLVKGYDQNLIQDIPISKHYNYVFTADSPLNEEAVLGCRHFTDTNIILEKLKETKIHW